MLIAGIQCGLLACRETGSADWAELRRYRAENAALNQASEERVVFFGNSIVDHWAGLFPTLFPGRAYVGRGVAGQTTSQMLLRFQQDVVQLHPAVVLILAGVNDLSRQSDPSGIEVVESNLTSMVELAQANGIRVVLATLLPVFEWPTRPGLVIADSVIRLNAWIREYSVKAGVTLVDFHAALADQRGGLPPPLSKDGLHPTEAAYRIMATLASRAIQHALEADLPGCLERGATGNREYPRGRKFADLCLHRRARPCSSGLADQVKE
jgi:lysophospholipase L1-like esterase